MSEYTRTAVQLSGMIVGQKILPARRTTMAMRREKAA
jgi:hypothetical protein